jgi:2-methylaconitate cis-trans-isomerase PrpF
MLEVKGLGPVPASLIDAANPCVFVPAKALGATATEQPLEIEQNARLLGKLEGIWRAASVAMGIAPDFEQAGSLSMPFVAFVAPPVAMRVLSGRRLAPADDVG